MCVLNILFNNVNLHTFIWTLMNINMNFKNTYNIAISLRAKYKTARNSINWSNKKMFFYTYM